MPQCRAKTEKGTQCRGFALPDSPYCFIHSPEKKEERAAAQRKGGRVASLTKRRLPKPDELPECGLDTAEDARLWSAWLVRGIAKGLLDNHTADRISTGLRTFLTAEKQANQEHQIKELQAQVRALKETHR